MKHTIEALHESAVALDHHLLRDPTALRIAGGIAIANCLLLTTALSVHGMHENDDGSDMRIRQASLSESQMTVIDTVEVGPLPIHSVSPHPKPVPKKVHHQAVKPTDLSGSYKWRSIHLASNPQTLPGDQYKQLLRVASTPKALTDLSHPQCEGDKSENFTGTVSNKVKTGIVLGLGGPKPGLAVKVPERAPIAVIGVTGGRPFSSNRCLIDLAGVPKSYDFYVNAANPGLSTMRTMLKRGPFKCKTSDKGCIAEAYGQMTGNHAVQLVQKAGLTAPHGYWWIDVETMNAWRGDGNENRRVLSGIIKALRAANPEPKIGFYSVPKSIKHPERLSQWEKITGVPKNGIVGGWMNGYDAWIATGSGTQAQALAACSQRKSFNGGRIVMSQHARRVNGLIVDDNVLCP